MDLMIKPDIIPLPPWLPQPFLIATLLFIADSHLEMHYIPADAEVGRIPLHILYRSSSAVDWVSPFEHWVPSSLTFEAAHAIQYAWRGRFCKA
jgi:hypothetical protein